MGVIVMKIMKGSVASRSLLRHAERKTADDEEVVGVVFGGEERKGEGRRFVGGQWAF